MGIDGKWLHRQGVAMIYRDSTAKVNLYWSWHPTESYESIARDVKSLLTIIESNIPSGVISG
ncbi:hypothetical protein HGB07_07725 [Candidatus Roizmanbacteria bacterium]|nr:hypothetical protein [Candidatus Roizmanbacteria bacterium]